MVSLGRAAFWWEAARSFLHKASTPTARILSAPLKWLKCISAPILVAHGPAVLRPNRIAIPEEVHSSVYESEVRSPRLCSGHPEWRVTPVLAPIGVVAIAFK